MKKGHDKKKIFSQAGFVHIEIIIATLAVAAIAVVGILINRFNSVLHQTAPTSEVIGEDINNWETHNFSRIGFAFKTPPAWMVVSDIAPEEAVVEYKVLNDNDPEGQYYNVKVLVGPSFYIGKKETLSGMSLPEDSQELSSSKEIINGGFHGPTFNGETYNEITVSGKTIVIYELPLNDLVQAIIPLNPIQGVNNNLSLTIENLDNLEILNQILSTFQFIDKSSETTFKNYTSKKLPRFSFPQFMFSYPSSWELIDESNSESSYTNIKLKQGKHTIQFLQEGGGAAACIFSDAQMLDGPVSDLRDTEFKQIETQIGTLRYFLEGNPGEAAVGNSLYKFCKRREDGTYANPAYPVSIGFETPENTSLEIFSEMEEIVKSVKEVE